VFFGTACRETGPGLDDAGKALVEAQQALAGGDSKKAMELLNVSIDARPDPWAYFQRAQLHVDGGDDEAARPDCRSGLALDPEHSDLLWLQAELDKSVTGRFKGSKAHPPRDSK
jgi:hypothetical protein